VKRYGNEETKNRVILHGFVAWRDFIESGASEHGRGIVGYAWMGSVYIGLSKSMFIDASSWDVTNRSWTFDTEWRARPAIALSDQEGGGTTKLRELLVVLILVLSPLVLMAGSLMIPNMYLVLGLILAQSQIPVVHWIGMFWVVSLIVSLFLPCICPPGWLTFWF
jgi:hypothetical protein